MDEWLLVGISHHCCLLIGWLSLVHGVCFPPNHFKLDTRRVSRGPAAICPQPGDLDMDSSKMIVFLPLQDPDGLLSGQSSNEPAEAGLLSPIHLIDPYALSTDEQGECSRSGVWGCSCRGDGRANRAMQHVPTSQGRQGFLYKRTVRQTYHCLVVVGFCMAGDRDTHRHLAGITADWVIGRNCWLALHRSSQAFVLVNLPLQAHFGCCGERGDERSCCVVDIRLGDHREVIGILPVIKGHRVLDRDACHAAETVEVKRGNVALRPDDCSMGGHGGLALNRGIARRNDRRGIGHDLDAIVPSKQSACCHRLAVGGSIVKRHGAFPYAGRSVAGAGGRPALALCRAADFQEACSNLLACWLRGTSGERRDGEAGRERLRFRHQRHRCGQGHYRSDEARNKHQRKQVEQETTAQPCQEKPRVPRTPLLLHWRRGKRGRVREVPRRRDGSRNHRIPTRVSCFCRGRWWRYRLCWYPCRILFFRVRLVRSCLLPFFLIGDRSEYQGRVVRCCKCCSRSPGCRECGNVRGYGHPDSNMWQDDRAGLPSLLRWPKEGCRKDCFQPGFISTRPGTGHLVL